MGFFKKWNGRTRTQKKFCHKRVLIASVIAAPLVIAGIVAVDIYTTPEAQGYSWSNYYRNWYNSWSSRSSITPSKTSTQGMKNTANKYKRGSEKAVTPVSIKIVDEYTNKYKYYNYVPFEINGSISRDLPGIMLDNKGNVVKDKKILKELFKYPGLVRTFTYNVAAFNKLTSSKASTISKYCKILRTQKIRFDEAYRSGTIVKFMYYGVKIAADVAGSAKSIATGLVALAKDLASGYVQDSIKSYFSSSVSRAVLVSVKNGHNNSKQAYSACQSALTAWKSVGSKSGKITTAHAENATADVYRMFRYEAESMSDLRQALNRINNYPRLITKIGKSDFTKGMSNLKTLISKLNKEKNYWYNEQKDSRYYLDRWAREHMSRVK